MSLAKKDFILNAGERLAIVGANDAGVEKFKLKGSERCQFFNVYEIRQLKELPAGKFGAVIVNKKVPSDIRIKLEVLAEQAGGKPVFMVDNSGFIENALEGFPFRAKSDVSLSLSGIIDLAESSSNGTNHADTIPVSAPQNQTPPRETPPSNENVRPKLHEVLKHIEDIYDQFNGDAGLIKKYFRGLGFNHDTYTDGAIYQQVRGVTQRRERKARTIAATHQIHTSDSEVAIPIDAEFGIFIKPNKYDQLLAAVAQAEAAQKQVIALAMDVLSGCSDLEERCKQQSAEIDSLNRRSEEQSERIAKLIKARQRYLDETAV